MSDDSFVHLHLHTEYSMLDGANRIADVMKKAREFGMPAVAMTDHGNLFGAIEFYQEAMDAGIKPIIGCEAYMAPGSRFDKNTSAKDSAYHFTMLAENETGYRNLVKLISLAHLEGQYYKPRIDREILAQYAEGIIGMSGCLKGEINQGILNDQPQKSREALDTFVQILGRENFFLELHNHGIEQQQRCNAELPKLAREFNLGLVAANDVHFLERSHHEAHDVMICIGTGSMIADERRMHYVPELYFKSPQEMRALFRDFPDALDNTLRIAERCNLQLEFGKPKYPNYNPPEGFTQNEFLRKLCEEGVQRRYGSRADSPEVRERLARELGVLETQGFVNYFLIVWDFINWAKERGIPVGPGRGSAAGSMVAYVIGITDIDPLLYKLLFERFLNPERVSPPDIDVDFCVNRRSEVIEYVREKYGERAVAQIVTFGTLGAKSVIRDVARVMGVSYGEADRIAKMIPSGPGNLNITLAGFDKKNKETGKLEHIPGAIDKNPELKKAVESEPQTSQIWQYANVLEGLTRNTGVHAAGVVISDRDLSEYIPLTRGNDGGIVSQYSMQPLTDLGMLKMDFLGLKTLTMIRDAETLIHAKQPDFDINTIPLDDQKTFDIYNRGETTAVFQVESGGMVNVCRQFDVQNIEDINAILALYRPGPMDLIPDYIKRKKGQARIKYAHPLLAKVCAETYGIFVYQEQVMQAAQVLAGYTLGGADLLRRAMGKKDKEKMAKEREKFIKGCRELNGIEEKKANEIFDLLEKFAGYGFNRSHSAAYAWVSYQTAYLKANWPVEFMAAVLSNEVNNTDKISTFVGECKRMGINILPPDVNKSSLKFTPEMCDGAQCIRYGLAAIKNVGEGAMQAAIEERDANGPFKSLDDFCARLDSRKINKKVLESLVKCGAFDWTGSKRAPLFAEIDAALAASAASQRDRASGQVSLFGDASIAAAPKRNGSSNVPPWPKAEMLAYEKELLGFYVTGHPLDEYRAELESGKFRPIASLAEMDDKATVHVAGSLVGVEKKFTKKDGKPFAVTVLEDLTGNVEMLAWSETYLKFAQLFELGRVVSVEARLDKREETPRLVASEVKLLKSSSKNGNGNGNGTHEDAPVIVRLSHSQTTESDLLALKKTIEEFPGSHPLMIEFVNGGGKTLRVKPGPEFNVELSSELQSRLGRLIVSR